MEKKSKPRPESIRPIDVRPGDLIRTKLHPEGVAVISSDLVEPGTHGPGGLRTRKHEWWISIVWTDQEGRINRQTERFPTGKFDQPIISRLASDS